VSSACNTSVAFPRYEVSGPPGAPVVVVLGGISATRHVCSNAIDVHPGWWEAVAGTGKAIDTRAFRVLSIDFVDGGAQSDGRPARTVSTHDQAIALADVLDHLGIETVHCVIGASYGGMVALAFAELAPDRVQRQVIIGAAHEPHPMTTAIRSVQRQIVELGLDAGRPAAALALARALAMTSYRTALEFARRFPPVPEAVTHNSARFPVDGYLRHHGDRFAATFAPARFLALSLSADLHRVDPSDVPTPTVVVAAQGDTVVPREQSVALTHLLPDARLVVLPSRHGHDAFLTEPAAIGRIVSRALHKGTDQ
jgi:homoserine O-acetyltransferase